MGGADAGRQVGGRHRPADLPPGEAERLAQARHHDGALAHAGERGDGDGGLVEPDLLVDLVGNHQAVGCTGDGRNALELRAREHAAGRVVRAVDQDGLGAGANHAPQVLERQRELRCMQPHRAHHAAGHGHACHVRVVERLHQHHLVARVDEPEHDRRDRLGAAARDGHLGVRVHFQAAGGTEARGDGAVCLGKPERPRVLAMALGDGAHARVLHELRAVEIRESLAKVHGAMLRGQPTDGGEDALAERAQALGGSEGAPAGGVAHVPCLAAAGPRMWTSSCGNAISMPRSVRIRCARSTRS